MTDLNQLERDLLTQVDAAGDEAALESVRVSALGKKGSVSDLLKTLGAMTPEERKERGPLINGLRDKVQGAIAAKKDTLAEAALEARLSAERIDVTLPVPEAPEARGRLHPISQVIEELTAIFADMGFSVAEGPDIETDYLNFTALNFPEGHPAREMHDTFFLAPDEKGERKVLRTHTSPVQIRTMTSKAPPIRVIIPGRTYRHDSDQTHTPMFHQVEGLVIDKQANIAHMKWVLEEFCKAFFEVEQVKMRFRPSFFPFTEPSAEVDIQCSRKGGEIRFGEGTDWLEILGCGMVHPNVLRNCGLDPGRIPGLCLGHGDRPHRHAQIRHAGPAPLLRGRCPLAEPLRLPPARHPEPCQRPDVLSVIPAEASRRAGIARQVKHPIRITIPDLALPVRDDTQGTVS